MKTEALRVLVLEVYRKALFVILIFCCSSCLVSNHLFIPFEAKSKSEDIIQGDGYTLDCYAMYALDDVLEINVGSKIPIATRIFDIKPYWIIKEDTVYAQLKDKYKSNYRFAALKIKKRKRLNVLVEYGREDDTVHLYQTHTLMKVRDYFFAIH